MGKSHPSIQDEVAIDLIVKNSKRVAQGIIGEEGQKVHTPTQKSKSPSAHIPQESPTGWPPPLMLISERDFFSYAF